MGEWLIAFEPLEKLKSRTRYLVFRSIWYSIRRYVLPLLTSWGQKNRPDPLQRNGCGRFVCMIYPSRIPTVSTLVFVIMY